MLPTQAPDGEHRCDGSFATARGTYQGSGVEHSIVFNRNNERALAMAHGLRNLDAARLKWGVQHLARVTRTMANLATQWNPVFWVTNFTRDYQTMLANENPALNARLQAFRKIQTEKVLTMKLPEV